MTQQQRELITEKAELYGIEPAIVYGVIKRESGGDQFAARFEPGWRWFISSPPGQPAICSDKTEMTFQATSMGLMQVMGAVYREHGYNGWLPAIFAYPEIQVDYGCRHLARKIQKYGLKGGISAYNAGYPTEQNHRYVEDVLRFSEEWQG